MTLSSLLFVSAPPCHRPFEGRTGGIARREDGTRRTRSFRDGSTSAREDRVKEKKEDDE